MDKSSPNVERLVEELDKHYINSVLEHSRDTEFGEEKDEDANKLPDAILVIDLNSREPLAAFVAPSLGVSKPTFLPVFKSMSKAQEAYLTGSKYNTDSKHSNHSQEWTKALLSHCQTLLVQELGMPLEKINLQVSVTSRSDASERDKFLLLQAVQDAGYKAPQLQLIPTVKAVAIAAFRGYGEREDDIGTYTRQRETWKLGDNVLVICHNGDVIDIQSYSFSSAAVIEKSVEPRLKLEEIVSGGTVHSRRLAEEQFTKWLENVFGKVLLGSRSLEPEGELMPAFARVVQDYEPRKHKEYKFPLKIPSPGGNVPYDPDYNCCVVPDSKMQEFCKPMIDSLLDFLDDNHTRMGNKKKTIDKILFAEPGGFSPYLKDYVTNWGEGMGIINMQNDLTVGFLEHELNPRVVAEVTLSSFHQNIEEVRRSPAHYGFKLDKHFMPGDEQWTFYTDPFSNTNYCSDTLVWQLRKDDPLESHFTLSQVVNMTFRDGTTSCESRLALYKCQLNDEPRHLHIQQNRPDPNVELVGTLLVTFRPRDIASGEYKQCDDGVFRRRLQCKTSLQLFYTHGTIKALAKSLDGRILGSATFQIHGVS